MRNQGDANWLGKRPPRDNRRNEVSGGQHRDEENRAVRLRQKAANRTRVVRPGVLP